MCYNNWVRNFYLVLLALNFVFIGTSALAQVGSEQWCRDVGCLPGDDPCVADCVWAHKYPAERDACRREGRILKPGDLVRCIREKLAGISGGGAGGGGGGLPRFGGGAPGSSPSRQLPPRSQAPVWQVPVGVSAPQYLRSRADLFMGMPTSQIVEFIYGNQCVGQPVGCLARRILRSRLR